MPPESQLIIHEVKTNTGTFKGQFDTPILLSLLLVDEEESLSWRTNSLSQTNEVQSVTSLPVAIQLQCIHSKSPLRNGNKTWWMWVNQSGWLSWLPLLKHSSPPQPEITNFLLLCSLCSSSMIQCVVQAFLRAKPVVDRSFRVAVAFSWGLWEHERSLWLRKVQLDGACLRIWSHVWSWRILVVFLHSSGCPYKQELASS